MLRASKKAVVSSRGVVRRGGLRGVGMGVFRRRGAGSRGFATEQQLKARIKTVGNISKITKAMKMVSAAKLRGVQASLERIRVHHAPIGAAVEDKVVEDKEDLEAKKHLLVVMTSDRGLCGGVNSACTKLVKTDLLPALQEKGKEVRMLFIGDKGRAGLERLYSKHFDKAVFEAGKLKPLTFTEASMLAELVLAQDFDDGTLIFNKFRSAIAYDTTGEAFVSAEHMLADSDQFEKFEVEGSGDDVLRAFHEFRLANRIFWMAYENATSEQSARMAAMDNSSKNAGEMLDKLILQANRLRQARITTELTEIVSGAASVAEGKD